MDMVLGVKNMVKTGETILAESFKKVPGGKGANQAVAAKRLGASVYMIGKVGMDDNGEVLLKGLQDDKIDTSFVFTDRKSPTGMAIITVDEKANNSIVVIPGANMNITKEEILSCEYLIKASKIIIAQFETPIEITETAFEMAKKNNTITILNPAPANRVTDKLLSVTDIIIPNETEAFELTGIRVENLEDAKKAASNFLEKGVKFAIITLGDRGAALISRDNAEIIPSYKVKAVDTTAAGDGFIGALSNYLCSKSELSFENLKRAVNFGNMVSSIVVQRHGAQTSIPTIEEVESIYGEVN